MEQPEQQQFTQYALRIPVEVKEKLSRRANQSRRSLNNEMVVRLENSLKAEEMLEQGAAQ